MGSRTLTAVFLALILSSCGDDKDAPLDGGHPLSFDREGEEVLISDPCWRREKGGWHLSLGHCNEMTSQRPMQGVWVTAFEETSFFPERKTIPDANDPFRFKQSIELDAEAVRERASSDVSTHSQNGEAFLISFIGRRTVNPIHITCDGLRYDAVVVDRLLSARYLGPMGPFDFKVLMARPTTVTVRHSGRWGELEAEAVRRCRR